MTDGLKMKYFVLKPSGSSAYAMASRQAMEAYANYIFEENPKLSQELHEWVESEDAKR